MRNFDIYLSTSQTGLCPCVRAKAAAIAAYNPFVCKALIWKARGKRKILRNNRPVGRNKATPVGKMAPRRKRAAAAKSTEVRSEIPRVRIESK